jgi:predicted RNA methylase
VVTAADTVLEIGTGSGLLAMLAAKQGAGHVFAIEANRNMADVAQV